RLESLALVREVQARHRGADGEELRGQLERRGEERAAREGRTGALARSRPRWLHQQPSHAPNRRRSGSWAAGGPRLRVVRHWSVRAKMVKKEGVNEGTPPLPRRPSDDHIRNSPDVENPIYTGDFRWLGKRHKGSHEPLITHDTFERVQAVLSGK